MARRLTSSGKTRRIPVARSRQQHQENHKENVEQDASDIELAIRDVLEAGYRTPDIAEGTGGFVVTTSEFGELICQAVAEIADMRHAYHAV